MKIDEIFILILILLFLFIARPKDVPQPKPVPDQVDPAPVPFLPKLNLIPIPIYQNRIKEDSVYADIVNRAEVVFWGGDKSNTAHETVHSINAQLRNKIFNKKNCFYINKSYISFPEPNIKKLQISEFVPQEYKNSLHTLYVIGQPSWNNQPLYILDEWVAYVATSQVDPNNTKGIENFIVFGNALVKAIEKYDADYLKDNPDFLSFIQFLEKISKKLMEK